MGGLSAGTVAAFAVAGWMFLEVTDSYDGPLAVPVPELSTERLVIESGPASTGGDAEGPGEEAPAEEPTRPTPERLSPVRAVAEEVVEPPPATPPVAPRAPVEPVVEEPAPPVERAVPPIVERGDLVPIDPDGDGCDGGDHGGGDVEEEDGGLRLVLEFEIRVPLSPKE
jgi:hypothetical protein